MDQELLAPPTDESKGVAGAAAYLSLSFALCHEVTHCLIGDVDEIVALPSLEKSDIPWEIKEAATDRIAYPIYVGFLNSIALISELHSIVAPLYAILRYSLGPAGFFAAASSIWLARRLFEFPRGCATDKERLRLKAWNINLEHIRVRRTLFNELIVELMNEMNGGAYSEDDLAVVGVLAEIYALESILQASIEILKR